jgi:uncharacterized membrane protein YdjX (TVP38/TMEM64 family)
MTQLKKQHVQPRGWTGISWLNAANGMAIAILALCTLMVIWLLNQSDFNLTSPDQWVSSIQRMGNLGIGLYMIFVAIAIIVGPIPSTPATIAAGIVWGPIPAGIYGSLGLFLGSLTAYFIGRTLGRSAVQLFLGRVIRLSNHRGEMYLGWLIFLAHVIPVVPCEFVSYGAGISAMSLPIFGIACILGIIPCTFLLTHLGSAFTVGLPLAIGLITAFVALITILPWGVKRYNWLGLRDLIQFD